MEHDMETGDGWGLIGLMLKIRPDLSKLEPHNFRGAWCVEWNKNSIFGSLWLRIVVSARNRSGRCG